MQLVGLFEVVLHAELQLRVVGRKGLDLVEWDKHFLEEANVLRLERGRQTRGNR